MTELKPKITLKKRILKTTFSQELADLEIFGNCAIQIKSVPLPSRGGVGDITLITFYHFLSLFFKSSKLSNSLKKVVPEKLFFNVIFGF